MSGPTTILRQLARGKPCQVRYPGICNGDPETVVLAHVNLAGIKGLGIKAPDICGAWACSACHAVYDRRSRYGSVGFDLIDKWFYEGVFRTLAELHKAGKV